MKQIPYLILVIIGFLNALPLSGQTLSIYLAELGFETNLIGLFCLLSFPMSVKIFWAPVIDHFTLPFFRSSPRKGWLLLALAGIALSFLAMGMIDPVGSPLLFACDLVLLFSFAACLYMVGIAYELEGIPEQRYSMGSASTIAGYRTGLLYAGAGILYIAHLFSWQAAFFTSFILAVASAIAIAIVPEPYNSLDRISTKRKRLSSYPTLFKGLLHETIMEPCRSLLKGPNWQSLLIVLLFFKIDDSIAKAMEGPFYLQLGFDKADIALASKTFGFIATIAGAFLAGGLIKDKNPFMGVALLGILHSTSWVGCWVHSVVGKSYPLLYLTTGIGNFTGGMAITAFIYLLWKTCDKHYAPVQYALLWSIYSTIGILLSCFGGFLATNLSWHHFFLTVSLLGTFSSLLMLAGVQRRSQILRFPNPSDT